jgi:hypothetical protein
MFKPCIVCGYLICTARDIYWHTVEHNGETCLIHDACDTDTATDAKSNDPNYLTAT